MWKYWIKNMNWVPVSLNLRNPSILVDFKPNVSTTRAREKKREKDEKEGACFSRKERTGKDLAVLPSNSRRNSRNTAATRDALSWNFQLSIGRDTRGKWWKRNLSSPTLTAIFNRRLMRPLTRPRLIAPSVSPLLSNGENRWKVDEASFLPLDLAFSNLYRVSPTVSTVSPLLPVEIQKIISLRI